MDELHLLRPQWLWALAPAVLIWLGLWRLSDQTSAWKKIFRLSLPNDFARKATTALSPTNVTRAVFGTPSDSAAAA